jgi:hypothetical protein
MHARAAARDRARRERTRAAAERRALTFSNQALP